jgi:hypothetical protein
MQAARRRGRRALWTSVAVILVHASGAAGAAEWRARSVAADGSRLELEIDLPIPRRAETTLDGQVFTELWFPGFVPDATPGAPDLYMDARLVALPPGGRARVQVLESRIEDLGTLRLAPRPFAVVETVAQARGAGDEFLREVRRFDARAYAADGAKVEPVRLGTPGVLRHQPVVALEIRPVLYDPATGRTRLVRRLRVAIDITGGTRAPRAAAAVATPPAWERLYGGALVNAASAEAWRQAPARAAQVGGALKSGLLRPGLLGEEEWKVRVRETGPHRVGGAALAAAGFPPSAPVGQLRLVLRRFDAAQPLDPTILEIPIQIIDADGDGAFETADSFLFYGEHPRDDTTSEDPLPRYTQENVYWLSLATSGTPARMPVRTPLAGATPGPASFAQQLAFEQDRAMNVFVYGDNDDLGDVEEMYFWTAAGRVVQVGGMTTAPVARVTVPVPGRAPGADVQLCVETQEELDNAAFTLLAQASGRDSVLVATNPGTTPTSAAPPARQTTCGSVPAAALAGTDLRVIVRPQQALVGFGIPFLDRIGVAYTATYTAVGNRIRCTSGGAAGATEWSIAGFTDPALRAFDITAPKAPAAFDLAGAFSAGTLRLTDDVPAAVTRTYLVVADAAIPAATVAVDRPERDDLRLLEDLATAPAGSYDCLVVVADELADEPTLAEWKAFREAQGHRLRIVRTSDVYDAFRGGLPHYGAIHRACQLAFRNWGIAYVALVGDGSEDASHILSGSGANLVPSRVRYFWVTGSSETTGAYRNDSNDKYYAQVEGPPGDRNPDLLVARIPASNPTELRLVLEKTMRYETPQPGDDGAWRKRVLMYADDEWVRRSVPAVSLFAHRRGCSEPGFERGIVQASDVVDGAFPGDLHAVRFLLRHHSDRMGTGADPRVPFIPEHRPVDPDSIFDYCTTDGQAHVVGGPETAFYVGTQPGQVGRALVDSVGTGCLFFALQSHASRVVVGDEGVLSARRDRPYEPFFDNPGKPFVFFGFGCHLNEYGQPNEDAFGFQDDALGELLVTTDSRGAVATYASTGFEYLQANTQYHTLMWRVIFEKRFSRAIGGGTVQPDTIAARWGLAELTTIAEIQYGAGDADIIARHVLFGDPMLRLDGGFPRIPRPDRITNGFLQADNRLVVLDRNLPLGLELTVRDEQGIDSLWVVRRYPGGSSVPIPNVTITALADTAAAIRAKRGYRIAFEVLVDECNFDIVVGARDLAGRVTEFIGHVFFEQRLIANGVPIQSRDRVDPRTTFAFEIAGCTPIPPPLPLEVYLDGALLRADQVTLRSDPEMVNWTAEFSPQLANGTHSLRFVYAGTDFATYDVQVGGFGMSEILAFPNPLTDRHAVMRIYFHLGEPIAGGHLRVVDVNGRTVLRRDLTDTGVVQSDVAVPPGQIGSSVGQGETRWNYVEVFRDGLDARGDALANGVYLYELQIRGLSGQTQSKRDRIVLMR